MTETLPAAKGKVPNRLVKLRPTPAVRRRLLAELESGATLDTAADATGVTWLVVQRWIERGLDALREDDIDKDDWPYCQLVIEIRQALARFETEMLAKWRDHGDEEWQAIRDLLERTRQEKYARPIRHTIGNADGLPFRIDIGELETASLGALRHAADALKKLQAANDDDIIDAEIVEGA